MLPRKISAAVNQISASTWNRLVDCLAYAMDHPRGDGHSVLNKPGGLLGTPGGATAAGGEPAKWPFAVSFQDGMLRVEGGWLNRNGLEMLYVNPHLIYPQAGYVCVCSEPVDKKGSWSTPDIRILSKPIPCAFPVAEVAKSGADWEIEQYPVAVAIILAAKRCPVAEL